MTEHQKTLLKGVAGFVAIAAIIIIAWKLLVTEQQMKEVIAFVESFGVWSLLVFGLIYVFLVTLSFPSSVFNIGAGIVFPIFQAIPLALGCGVAAATLTFLFSRFMFYDTVREKLKQSNMGKDIAKLVNDDSAKVIILLRLNPFIPAIIKNYGLGVTEVSVFSYVFYTLLGQIPLTLLYVYLGWIGGQRMLGEQSSASDVHYIVLGLGIVISLGTLLVSHLYFRKKVQAV